MITGLNHITLSVSQLDRSLAFNSNLLSFTLEARWDSGAYLSAGDLWLCLSVGEARPARDYTHIALTVSAATLPVLERVLRDEGVRCWQQNASEGDSFYFLDPDGHQLELHDGSLASRLAAVSRAPYAGWRTN